MLEQADRCQQPQGSGGSGLDDDPDLHDLSSPADDQFVGSHQTPPSSAVYEGRPNDHQWRSALLSDPAPPAYQAHQLQKAASEQLHHERIAEAQHAHHVDKNFHRELQGQGTIQHGGYQSMNRQRAFDPGDVQKHFRGIGLAGNTLEEPTARADPAVSHVAVRLLRLCHRTDVTLCMSSAGRCS